MPNLKFLALTFPEILGGAKIPKVGHITIFDLILHIPLELTAIRVQGKIDVSSFNGSRDTRESQI